ncbi:MAG: DUF6799 domain-containing protein [Chthoniobacter sp.]
MKTIACTLALSAALLAAAQAQTPLNPNIPDPPQRSITPAGTARDGFFARDNQIFMVRNGVTTKVEREIIFPNGLRVQPNGTVTLRDGTERTLISNQWLNFEGSLEDFTGQAAAPAANTAAARDSGVSSRDGISISGTDVFITRNGATEKVTSEIRLSNGIVVRQDGTVVMSDGKKITLRSDQVLSLDGVLREAPVTTSPGGVAPSSNPPQ